MFKTLLIQAIRHPYMALGCFLLVGALFAGLISLSYPDAASSDGNVPLIQAESRAFKIVPDETGGMEIANRDSTVFDTLRSRNGLKAVSGGRTENLLDPPGYKADEVAEEKLAAFSQSVEEIIEAKKKRSIAEDLNAKTPAEQLIAAARPVDTVPTTTAPVSSAAEQLANIEPAAGSGVTKEEAVEVLIEDTQEETLAIKPASKPTKPAAKLPVTSAPVLQNEPGSSPETIAFVRSVLDEKKAQEMATIMPGSGVGATAGAAISGNYFVQLASVTSMEAAQRAWGSFQSQYKAQLTNANHRVETADLGSRGTYYRVQAGPYSESKAEEICASIKAVKPGGCLVVKK